MKPAGHAIDRRTLLVGGGAGVGLAIAYAVWPRRRGSALQPEPGEAGVDHWLKIAEDGRVTVAVPQVETGQGAWTGLAQLLADELGAAWEMVGAEPAPAAPVYANPLAGEEGWLDGAGPWRSYRIRDQGLLRVTAGSTSVRAFEPVLREAGALARTMLVEAAARRWGVAPAECDSADGFVVHGGQRLGFGELAAAAAAVPIPRRVALRPAPGGRLVGEALPRLDLPGKSDGSAQLGADVRLPEMLFAAVRLAPRGGRLTGFDRRSAERHPGLVELVVRERWLAAIGATWWAAERALAAAGPRFTGPADSSTPAIAAALDEAIDLGRPSLLFERGKVAEPIAGAAPISANYSIAAAPHLGLEALTATARFSGDRLEVWAPSQAPGYARLAAARAAAMPVGRVTFYPMPVGDCSGRALEADAVPIAVELAGHARAPVQLILSHREDQRFDRLRPPARARMAAMPAADGTIGSWSARIACAAGEAAAFARLDGRDPPQGFVTSSLAGAIPPYSIPAMRIEAAPASLPIATGYMRGGAHGLTGFFNESFVDELARSSGAEPLAYRMAMLGGNIRLARAISTAAAIGGWDGGGDGSSLGLACHSAFGSHIGLMAEASIGSDQRVAVSRLVAVVDCGRVVNRGLVRQQIEGGLIAAMGMATATAPEFIVGQPIFRRLGPIGLPRLGSSPKIEVELIESDDPPGGVSGLGMTVLAPALANALHSATGRRFRNLPFDPGSAA